MKKLLFFCRRRHDLTHEAYTAHLLERHAALALQHHASLAGYSLDLVEHAGPGAPALDSINCLWYASLEEFQSGGYDSPEGERRITEDHARFLGGADGYVASEAVVRSRGPGPALGTRSPGQKRVYAVACDDPDAWLERCLPLLETDAGIRKLVIDRVEEKLFDTGPDWDLLCEITRDAGAREDAFPEDPSLRRLAVYHTAEYVLRSPS